VRAREQSLARLAWALGCSVVVLGLTAVALDAGVGREWYQVVLDVLALAVVGLVGARIAARQPANLYGWVWLAVGLGFGGQAVLQAGRDVSGSDSWWLRASEWSVFLGVLVLLLLALLLFPTGRLPSRAWRWLPGVAVLVAAGSLGAALLAPLDGEGPARGSEGSLGSALGATAEWGILVLYVLILVAAGSVFLRFRRAGRRERQQLKWFLLAAGVNGVVIVLELSGLRLPDPVWSLVDTVSLTTIPVAVGIAVLRYRLYDIDRIISRSVSYGLLTGGLVALYLVLVTLLRPLLEPLTGSSTLAVAGSTLAIAALFNPARRRLQAAVDRRFDRARYDAGRAVDAFASRLREQVDLDEVTTGLRETVGATLAPACVGLWLRDSSTSRGA